MTDQEAQEIMQMSDNVIKHARGLVEFADQELKQAVKLHVSAIDYYQQAYKLNATLRIRNYITLGLSVVCLVVSIYQLVKGH